MTHIMRTVGEQYVYTFTRQQVKEILIQHIKDEHWERPHDSKVDGIILDEVGDEFQLIMECCNSKQGPSTRSLKKFDLPEEEKPDSLIDIKGMSADELLDLAAKIEEEKDDGNVQVKKLQPIPLELTSPRGMTPQMRHKVEKTLNDTALSFTEPFTHADFIKKLAPDFNGKLGHAADQRIRLFLNNMIESGLLQKEVRERAYKGAPYLFYKPL